MSEGLKSVCKLVKIKLRGRGKGGKDVENKCKDSGSDSDTIHSLEGLMLQVPPSILIDYLCKDFNKCEITIKSEKDERIPGTTFTNSHSVFEPLVIK